MLTLVKVRARTRGKSPVEFGFEGVGKPVTRKVMDKDNNPIILDDKGNQVAYEFTKDGKLAENADGITQDEKGELVLPEGYRYVEVDDLDATGVTSDLNEVIDLFGTIPSDQTPLQRVIDGALNWFNASQRKAASPVTEVDKDDELTPLVTELVAKGILSQENVAVWRRTVSLGAKSVEMSRSDFAELTKEVKKLRKAA